MYYLFSPKLDGEGKPETDDIKEGEWILLGSNDKSFLKVESKVAFPARVFTLQKLDSDPRGKIRGVYERWKVRFNILPKEFIEDTLLEREFWEAISETMEMLEGKK
jgi:hypothetical protein